MFGEFITGLGLTESGGGGGIYWSILPGPLLLVFGIVLMTIGSRPRRFSKHK